MEYHQRILTHLILVFTCNIYLTNGWISINFNNSVLVEQSSSRLYSNFRLNVYTVLNQIMGWIIQATILHQKNYLFGTVKLIGSTIKTNFIYNGWGIAFDEASSWSSGNDFARNVAISGVDNASSSHTDNQKNNVLVLVEGPLQYKICFKFALQWQWRLFVWEQNRFLNLKHLGIYLGICFV